VQKINKKGSQLLGAVDLPPVKSYLSTGCTILDLAIANRLPGGFGAGRISHVYGPESSAKSVIALEPLGSAQRQGGLSTFIDAEVTLDLKRAKELFGIDVKKLLYISGMDDEYDKLTVEELFDEILPDLIKEAKENGKPCAVTIDSLSAIPSNVEMDEDIDKASYGTSRAKSLSKGFRKYIWELSKSGLALIFVDQTRQNVGVLFGKQHTFSGGEALKFYASTRVLVKKSKNILNSKKAIVGIEIDFVVEKNKIAPPFRAGTFRLLFDYGIDNIGTNLSFLKNAVNKKGNYFVKEKSFKSLDRAIKYVEDNDLEKELENEVYRMWKEIHQPTRRKRKKR